MSRFHLHGYNNGARAHTEECDTADAALGVGRRLAAEGAVVFAFTHRDDGRLEDLALFIDDTMLPNRALASADNPLLSPAAAGRAGPARRGGGRQRRQVPPPK